MGNCLEYEGRWIIGFFGRGAGGGGHSSRVRGGIGIHLLTLPVSAV